MVPTRQSAPLLQEPSGPDPPTCGAAMELLMLFNYFGYQGPQNRFPTYDSDHRSPLMWQYTVVILDQ